MKIIIKRDSFVFYRSFFEAICEAPDDVRLQTYEAIVLYALDGVQPDLKGWAKSIFKMAKPQIDANTNKYINGCKGGAPVGNENAKKQPKNNHKQPKNNQKQPNVNDNEKENENVNVNDNEKENENVPLQGGVGDLDLSFLSDFSLTFQAAIKEWMQYKSERRERMTNQQIRECVKLLCQYDDTTAAEIVSKSIAGGYKGLATPHQSKKPVGMVQTENNEQKYIDSLKKGW